MRYSCHIQKLLERRALQKKKQHELSKHMDLNVYVDFNNIYILYISLCVYLSLYHIGNDRNHIVSQSCNFVAFFHIISFYLHQFCLEKDLWYV